MSMSESDQAWELRRIVEAQRKEERGFGNMRTIAILSGKGGVGKSNLALALSCAMADKGKRVVLLDADLGLANIDILSGITSKYNLSHIINGSRSLKEVLVQLEDNVWILPGGSGLKALADLDDLSLTEFITSLEALEEMADVLIIDTGAGIHRAVLSFASAVDTALLVTTPEPTSVRDAYGVVKAIKTSAIAVRPELSFVVNMAASESEAREVSGRLRQAVNRFLEIRLSYSGYVLNDEYVVKAVRHRSTFFRLYPLSGAAECVRRLADVLLGGAADFSEFASPSKGLKAFFLRLARGYFSER